jgi:amino acid transporter
LKTDFFGGILIAMWNYMGWDNASTIAGDVKDARNAYSRAMFISLFIVVATYIVPILAAEHAGLSMSEWETGSWVTIAGRLGGNRLALWMTAAGVVAALSTFNALVLSLSRLPYAITPWREMAFCQVCSPKKTGAARLGSPSSHARFSGHWPRV